MITLFLIPSYLFFSQWPSPIGIALFSSLTLLSSPFDSFYEWDAHDWNGQELIVASVYINRLLTNFITCTMY
jgi:hypothetical protein